MLRSTLAIGDGRAFRGQRGADLLQKYPYLFCFCRAAWAVTPKWRQNQQFLSVVAIFYWNCFRFAQRLRERAKRSDNARRCACVSGYRWNCGVLLFSVARPGDRADAAFLSNGRNDCCFGVSCTGEGAFAVRVAPSLIGRVAKTIARDLAFPTGANRFGDRRAGVILPMIVFCRIAAAKRRVSARIQGKFDINVAKLRSLPSPSPWSCL